MKDKTSKKEKKPARRSRSKKTHDPEVVAEVLPKAEDGASDPAAILEEGIEVLPPEPVLADGGLEAGELSESDSKSASDLVPYDPLGAYLRELQRLPALTKEEEHALALRYYSNKDREAAYRLVSGNLWLVVKIARDYERAARNILDLIQEGNIGLMEAVKNFDPYRGVRFPSYAVWWIRAYIIRYVIANWRLVKIGTTQAQRKLFFNLKKEQDKLEKEGFYPAPKLLAEKLDVKESDVIEMEQRLSGSDVSVDAPLQDDGETNLHALLPSGMQSAEDLFAEKQEKELLRNGLEEFASTLKEKELIIFQERMMSEEKATLQELAVRLSLSRERIRQIENRIREKLKTFLAEKFGTSIGTLEF